eukprot:TRINITY_DN3081_c0_g1_i1.p1 TRINITY_DN3081_c0_g1~~TRINITY_DN3081_c0_g1_i1.p1  ORF type:complete len:867 (-),score=248.76 TRINITY_DN3081_c0_g1_i1:153-2753(-)
MYLAGPDPRHYNPSIQNDPNCSAFQKPSSTTTPRHQARGRSLLSLVTVDIVGTFTRCSDDFRYTTSLNPRRVLTKPSEPCGNDGHDNENCDYILYVNEILGPFQGHQYQVIDVLGQGTFGQVVKCVNITTKEQVAIKVVKNKPAYFNQGLTEIQIIEMLNHQFDQDNTHHIIRLLDYFIFKNHLCMVTELLSLNLFELIKQNSYKGLSLTLIRCFLILLLDGLSVMQDAHVIHCDLKPENILLESLNSPSVKIIDFGSACFENNTVYSYIQSRFYRSPEVLIGVSYDSAIDMWSLGCISAELFLGLPLFPGTNEYNQLWRILDMLGHDVPPKVLAQGIKSSKFFHKIDTHGKTTWQLKDEKEYALENNIEVQPSKKYFKYKSLPEIVERYTFKENLSPQDLEKEKHNRKTFTHFLLGILNLDPELRWTSEQAQLHPFITGENFTGTWEPPARKPRTTAPRTIPWGIQNSKINLSQRPISMSVPDGDYYPMPMQDEFTPSSFNQNDFYAQNFYKNTMAPPSIPMGSPHSYGSYGYSGNYPGSVGSHGIPMHPMGTMHFSQGPMDPYLSSQFSPRGYQMPYQPPMGNSLGTMGQPPMGNYYQNYPMGNNGGKPNSRERSKSDTVAPPREKIPLPIGGKNSKNPRSPRQSNGNLPESSGKSNGNSRNSGNSEKKYSSWGHREQKSNRDRSNSGSTKFNPAYGNSERGNSERQNSERGNSDRGNSERGNSERRGLHKKNSHNSQSSENSQEFEESPTSPRDDDHNSQWEDDLLFEIESDVPRSQEFSNSFSGLHISKSHPNSSNSNIQVERNRHPTTQSPNQRSRAQSQGGSQGSSSPSKNSPRGLERKESVQRKPGQQQQKKEYKKREG